MSCSNEHDRRQGYVRVATRVGLLIAPYPSRLHSHDALANP